MFFLKTFGLRVLFCLRYLRLFLAVVIGVFLLPILFFCPASVSDNFGDKVDSFLLKILWFIWCVIKLCFFIVFAIILMLITPVLIIWPPLCVAIWVWAGSIKIF